VLSHRDTYAAENVNGTAGVPGTDSNDETTYVIQDNTNSSSTVEEESYDYLPNERITKETSTPGVVDYAQSSISVTAINYNILREEDARTQGLLDDVSWDEYKLANAASQPLEVTDEMIDIVAKATGIARENIAMVAYTEPIFFDREAGVNLTDVLQIILILLILGLLAFVILRSMRQQKSPEDEAVEELSVEQLLESQPDLENLENIEVEESSELKRLIEKFVEDNPEAAAILLRNWLSEDFA
ncbi:MAG: flagellar M-ring protein FliF, partial [Lachnospiraceae bacterium]|nr:flagellar M-ring protein FliF [Lachnospiraceae bacterium]